MKWCARRGGCWVWMGKLNTTGYGLFSYNGKYVLAHRWLFDQTKRKIPDGKELDHLCRVRRCVFPSHLQIVTHRQNSLRGVGALRSGECQRGKTHCPKGHPYSPENTYLAPNYRNPHLPPHRQCKQCKREGNRRQAERA